MKWHPYKGKYKTRHSYKILFDYKHEINIFSHNGVIRVYTNDTNDSCRFAGKHPVILKLRFQLCRGITKYIYKLCTYEQRFIGVGVLCNVI